MTVEVKVISVRMEGAVIGVGPTTELLWVAGKVLFSDLSCGYQDTCFSCFSKLRICLYSVLFYFAMKRLKKKKLHTNLLKPFNGLIVLVVRKSSSCFTWWTRLYNICFSTQSLKAC